MLLPPPNCAWGVPNTSTSCSSSSYAGPYPLCALFQYADRQPVPCAGEVGGDHCVYTGSGAGSTPPTPASWHVHVFFPSPHCTNCSEQFVAERTNFSFEGGMELRARIAATLNALTPSERS